MALQPFIALSKQDIEEIDAVVTSLQGDYPDGH